ncbi:unnamed protein product [Mytilus edulis]|uniref:B box-type domain-containing protein n=1 Tax=Mytilus edulis TaxID=6550 RepID=A0A8S3RAE0_MYTED|nr:unnamed protein product [Mytilus edulis]
MATSRRVVCEICEAQHITKSAIYWCPECEEGLCSICQKHHSFSKGTRNHETISIENYLKLPSSISKIATYCREHNLKYQNYCPQHDKICCAVCISELHKNCTGLQSLQEIVKFSKESAWLENIEKSLKDMRYNYESIMKDKERNLATIESQRICFYNEIKHIREKLNSHLDLLVKQIVVDLNSAEQEIKSKTETLMSQLSEKINTIESLQTSMSSVKEYATDLQTFLGSKSLESEIQREEIVFQSLIDDDSFHQTNLKSSISEKILDLLTTVKAFGSVSIETSKPSIVLKTDKEKQAQILSFVPHPFQSIENINISFKSNLSFTTGNQFNLRGFSVSHNGLMVLSDFNGKLGILHTNGTFDLIKKYSTSCNDVTFIDDTKIAVSANKMIEIIKIGSKVREKVICLCGECNGICYNNGALICNVSSKGIQEVQLCNGKITDLVIQKDLNDWSYITVHKDKIYQTASNTFVRCYTMNGVQLWEFNTKTPNRYVRGITVDISGNVYVALYKVSSILLLSSDGQRSRCVELQEMANPWRLHFNAQAKLLRVAGLDGSVLLYNILVNDFC